MEFNLVGEHACGDSSRSHVGATEFYFYMIEVKPENLIGDEAYDSDELDASLKKHGVEMIALHRSNRKLKTQDGRRLRRYERRWLVERYFAWPQWKRRILIRWVNRPGFQETLFLERKES